MDFLPLIIDNGENIMAIIGTATTALGITVPLLKPTTTKKVGVAIGSIAKSALGQKRKEQTRRMASTAEQLCEGILEGME